MEDHKITFGKIEDGKLTNVRLIKQSDIGKCPFLIMVPEHYREDGTCKCNDPEHREMMKKRWGYKDRDFKRAGIRAEVRICPTCKTLLRKWDDKIHKQVCPNCGTTLKND